MGWKDLASLDVDELIKLRECTAPELEVKLGNFINENEDYQTSLKLGALIDCFFNIYLFSNEEGLSDEALLQLVKLQTSLLQNCENHMTLNNNINYFRKTLTTEEEEENMTSYKIENAKKLIDYVLVSFFQHYELYTYMFTNAQEVKEITKEIFIDMIPTVQPFPPPLEESLCEDWYDSYVNPSQDEQLEADSKENDLQENEQDLEKDSTNVDLEGTAGYVLTNINQDDVKRIINEVATEKLSAAKAELENKIMEKESILLKSLNKMQIT